MKQVFVWCRDRPGFVLPVIVALTVFFGYHARGIRIDASTRSMTIADDPDRQFYEETVDTFGSDNTTIVYVKDPEVFTSEILTAVEEVFYQLEEVAGVSRVDGLFTTTNFKGEDGMLTTSPLLDWVPTEPEELAQIEVDARRNPLVNRVFVAPEESAIALTVIATVDPTEQDFNLRLAADIDRVIEPLRGQVDEVFQVGVPHTRRLMSETIRKDFFRTGPFFYVVLFTVLILGMRSVNGVLLPLLTSGISIIWTVGFMVLVGIPLNMLTWVIPALVLILGATEDMHLLSEYREGLLQGRDRMGAIEFMAEKSGIAVLLTGITTFLGFLSIVVNEITILQQFGLAAAFGLFVNPIVTFSVCPVYLRYFGEKSVAGASRETPGAARRGPMARWADACVHVVTRRPGAVVAVVAVAIPLALIGIAMVEVDNDLIGYFRPGTELRVHAEQLHDELSGMQSFYVVVDSQREGGFREADNVRALYDIQRRLDELGRFDTSLSLADHVALVNREMADGAVAEYRVPEDDDLIAQYLLFFTRDDLERYVSPDYRRANINVRHNLSSSHELNRALESLDAALDGELDPSLRYRFTGESMLFNNAADSMARGQAYSLGLILACVFLVVAALFLRAKAGLLALVPNGLPILLLFGVMGLVGVPLNPGTAMIAACAIGVAVDDTIHLFTRYHHEVGSGKDQMEAIAATVRGDFRPVCTTSAALAAGFATLGFSSFVPMSQYGWLSALVMIFAFATDLLVTPLLLARTRLVTLWDFLGLRLTEGVLTRSELFRDMSRSQVKKVVLLAGVEPFAAAQPIIRQGETGRRMYVILEGGARVEVQPEEGAPIVLRELAEGDVFGEIGLVSEATRTAGVIATADTRVMTIDWDALERVRRIFPRISTRLFLNISRLLGARLTDATAQLASSERGRISPQLVGPLVALLGLFGAGAAVAGEGGLGRELLDNTSYELRARVAAYPGRPEPREELQVEDVELDVRLEIETGLQRGAHQLGARVWLNAGSVDATYSQEDYRYGFGVAERGVERRRRYFDLNELYWIGAGSGFDVTIGKKRLDLGLSLVYSPADRITWLDLNDPLDIREYGVWQAVVDVYHGDSSVSFGVLPFFIPPKVPSDTSRWVATQQAAASDFQFFDRPQVIREELPSGADEVQGFARLKTTWSGWDFELAVGSTISPYPVLRDASTDPTLPAPVREYLRATHQSLGFSTVFSSVEVHGEGLLQWSNDDRDDDYFAGVIGLTYTVEGGVPALGLRRLELTLDYAREEILDRQSAARYLESSGIVRVGQNDVIARAELEVDDNLRLQLFSNFDLDDEGSFASAAIRYRPLRGLWLTLGAEGYFGGASSFYGRWSDSDRFVLTVEHSF